MDVTESSQPAEVQQVPKVAAELSADTNKDVKEPLKQDSEQGTTDEPDEKQKELLVEAQEKQDMKEEAYQGGSLPEAEQDVQPTQQSESDPVLGDANTESQTEEQLAAALEPADDAEKVAVDEETKEEDAEKKEDEPEKKEFKWQDLIGSEKLMKKKIRMAEDMMNRPQQGQMAHIKYIGKVKATGEQVDSGERWLGILEGDVIQAIDITASSMAKGEICEVHSHSDLCWGATGREPEIPPNTDMIYEIELLDFKDGMDPNQVSAEELLQEMNRRKDIGNGWLKRGDSFFAVQSYTRALQILEGRTNNSKETSADSQKLVDVRLVLLNNLAQAALKNGAFERAVEHADKVLELQPDNEKALWRKAKGLESQGKYKEAKKFLDKLCRLYGEIKLYKSTLDKVTKKLQEEKEKEKKMYSKMFNVTPSQKPKSTKAKDSNAWIGWVVGAGIVAAIAVTAFRFFSS